MAIMKLQTQLRREQIVQAALTLIAGEGLNGLSMTALARRVGMGTSSLYRHFAGKDEVLDGVVDLLRERLLGNVRIAIEEAADPLEQLRRLLAMHMRLILEYQAIPRLFFSGDLYAGHPERKAKLFGIVMTYLEEVAAIIRRGQEQGAFRPDLDPDSTAVVFLGLIQPPAILSHLSEGQFDVEHQLENGWPIFHEAIRMR
ncbi:MAG: TetR/AcrR family transcriptional regulator [Syntrophobacteraceae bacterium]|nr:TetR/AcrR family transcriptional regulator [Syntrophobacteraceae bacterium]